MAQNSSFFVISRWTQYKLLRLRLRRRYNKNRAIIELRSIADHCACANAWSHRSCSFDRPVRTGDVLKFQVLLSPVRLPPHRSKPGTCELGLKVFRKARGRAAPLGREEMDVNSRRVRSTLLWEEGDRGDWKYPRVWRRKFRWGTPGRVLWVWRPGFWLSRLLSSWASQQRT